MLKLLRHIASTGLRTEAIPLAEPAWRATPERIQEDVLRLLGRALAIRHVDAGSCNACELEIHALNNPYYNIEGRGIRFVASPRHADLLLVTGPVARNMKEAVLRAHAAMPEPKLVVAVGDCARGCGVFGENYATVGAVSRVLPVDVAIPGCPPAPVDILRGILAAVAGRASAAGSLNV